jgi:TolB-like protein/Flp pilus assembly protein TadD
MQASLHETRPSAPAGVGVDAAAVRAHLEKVLSSQSFKAAKGQSKFLRYVVEEALAGRADAIKEYSIGVEVFGRGPSFDPRISNIVRVEAQRLRSKLAKYYEGDGRTDALRIELPKGGYAPSWAGTPAEFNEAGAASFPAVSASASRGRLRTLVLFGLVLVASCLGALWIGRQSKTPAAGAPSVVVLPFVNLSGDKGDEYFSDGLTDELIASLGRVQGLRVVARGSAFQFKGQNFDVREIGRRLNVRNVLEGSVRNAGGRVRITVHLDDAANGYRIWSNIFERNSSDALAIQREISQAVVNSLKLEFAGQGLRLQDAKTSGDGAAVNPAAYQAYLKGLYFWNKNTAESIRTAIEYFQHALAKDPGYAPIYAGLGRCYTALPVFTATSSDEVIPKIREVASKALALDPNFGEAHLQLGEAFFLEYDWPKAEQELKRAVELSPGDPVVHRWRSYYFDRVGRLEEALAETTAAQELDPVSPYMAEGVAESYRSLRRNDEAIQQSQKALALEPNFVMALRGLGISYIRKGKYEEGVAQLKKALQLNGADAGVDGELGYAYAISGKQAEARQLLGKLLDQSKRGPFHPLTIAEVYIGLGDKNQALQWLGRAVDQHEIRLSLKTDPLFDPLRSDSRFEALLRRMKLL